MGKKKFIHAAIFLIPALLFLIFMPSCSLPRIVILDDPLSPEEHINLGVAYEHQGLFDEAIDEYNKASKKVPLAYLYLANAYMQKNDFANAERYYKKAIKENPDSSDAYNNLAWLYYIRAKDSLNIENKRELLKKAEGLSSKAIEINPTNENYIDTFNKIRELISENEL
jgi:tetratricopeptide (TPR) repeat protein